MTEWLKRVGEPEKSGEQHAVRSVTEFAASLADLPEGGRWHELHEGVPTAMEPPDDVHGNIVRNLTMALARWLQQQGEQARGYACHEIGLVVRRSPGTVFCPAISYFEGGQLFHVMDEPVTAEVPRLVIDIASTNDRRGTMHIRARRYLQMGVPMVWVPDPINKETSVLRPGAETAYVRGDEQLSGRDLLPGLALAQDSIYRDPVWWSDG